MQASQGWSVRIFQFGPYELDTRTGELRRAGVKIKLQEQPRRILELLLQIPGEIVSREILQKQLWSDGTFVDYEAALNTAIHKLRIALGDSAEVPRFVETVGRRGYRFIAPVKGVSKIATAESTSAASDTHQVTSRLRTRVLGVALLLATISVGGYLYAHRSPKLTDKDTIVLADFANSSGEPVFDETLRQGMAVQLGQSPFLSIVSDERAKQVMRLMGRPADAQMTADNALEVCERTQSAAVLDGSIAKMGNMYVLGMRAKNCRTGDVFFQDQMQTASKEEVLNALGTMASKFRERAGESLASVNKYDTRLVDATTPSLEALKSFSEARRVLFSEGSAAALPLFKRAVEIDPKFAIAHAWVGRMYGDLGEFELSAEATSKAYELRGRASDVERFFIEASYDMQVTGNLEKARRTCEAWIQAYPRDFFPHSMLSGIILPTFGAYETAVEHGLKVTELDPDFVVGYMISSYSYEALDRFDDAEAMVQKATARHLEMQDTPSQRFDLAFLKGDKVAMEAATRLQEADPVAEAILSNHEAFAAAYGGHMQEARRLSKRAAEMMQQASQKENAAQFQAVAAMWEAWFGSAAESRKLAETALKTSDDRDAVYGAALALAIAHDAARAEMLANELEARFPEDTSVKFNYVPTLRAKIAVERGKPEQAVEALQTASPYDMGQPRSEQHAFFGALYPIYFRGEAYLAMGKGAEGAAEFEKIRKHPGIVASDPVGALARLELGRSYAKAGDSAKAKKAYEEFLGAWKDADVDLPILKQAKSEYAALQ